MASTAANDIKNSIWKMSDARLASIPVGLEIVSAQVVGVYNHKPKAALLHSPPECLEQAALVHP